MSLCLQLCSALPFLRPSLPPGGFISGGRRQARPVVERKRSNKMGKSGEHAVVGQPSAAGAAFRTPNSGGGRKARPVSASSSGPSSSNTPGVLWRGGCTAAVAPAVQHVQAVQRDLPDTLTLPHLACPAVPAGMPAELYGTSPASASATLFGSSPSGSGRRARRNARRAAMDAGMDAAAHSPLCR